MNTRIAILAVVAVLALVGGAVVFTSVQNKAPIVAASPTSSATVVQVTASPAPPTIAPTAAPTRTPEPSAIEVAGKVIDRNGVPVSGASVRLFRATAGCTQFNVGQRAQVAATSTSSADGSFSLKVPTESADAEGKYYLYAQVTGRGFTFYSKAADCTSATVVTNKLQNVGTLVFITNF